MGLSIAERIEGILPYLRRYARASTGDTQLGDSCVENVLKFVLAQSLEADFDTGQYNRVGLFALLNDELERSSPSQSAKARRALLLSAVEGFEEPAICRILAVKPHELQILLDMAEKAFAETTATRLLIIEDEPLIAARLKRLAEELGHQVIGIADTASRAIALGQEHMPDIVLCDINLADGSLGTDAIAEMNLADNIPVVFITAYPDRYLSTFNEGPSYLITKPFDVDYLKAVIGHALINVQSA